MRLLLALVALVGCRRASDERVADDRVSNDHEEGWVEHVLPSIGLPAPTIGPIGTEHPTTLVVAADNGRWVVACQARVDTDGDGYIEVNVGHHGDLYGDLPRPYLFRGGGVGQSIQELVAVSPDERWLAIMRGGALVLIDDTNGRETTIIDADLRPDQRGYSRIATFDAESKRLIYFRANVPGSIVIRDLAQPRERVVRMSDARAWRVVAERGHWARFHFVREDTDKNGTLDWPTVNTNAPIGDVCRGPALSYSTFGGGGDDVVDAWLDLEKGSLEEDSSILVHLEDGAIERLPDGSIGQQIAPHATLALGPACDAQVGIVYSVGFEVRLVIVCGGKEGDRLPVQIVGFDFHATLDVKSERRDTQRPPRVVYSSIYCQGDPCFDLITGKRIAMRGAKVETYNTSILSRDGDQMYWMASPTATPVLVPNIDGYYANAMAGSIAVLDKGIIDLATGRVLGYAPKTQLAVDTRGRVLVPADDTGRGLPTGPLTWADPLPQPPPKPTEN